MVHEGLPFYSSGPVISGFQRGSKDLGIPTANYPEDVVNSLPDSIKTGIYFGWAQIDNGPVYKMVMSIGWNPYYKNEKKTMETHILHKFEEDFYGRTLKTCLVGFIRSEKDFNSLDDLIAEINNDIEVASKKLDDPEIVAYKTDKFFS